VAADTVLTALDDVLAYRHPGVVRRYVKDQAAAPAEAEEVFRELLKWLYVAYRSVAERGAEADEPDAGCVMTSDLEKIDRMWHTFLLFTQDYAEFCERYFGFFLHHVPEDAADEEPPPSPDALGRLLERQYALVYDILGEPTLRAWYDECRYAVD
jgi:hypothetical protein